MKFVRSLSAALSLMLSSCVIFPHSDRLAEKVVGSVVNERGEPVSGAKIDYIFRGLHKVGHTHSKRDGSYAFGPFRQWFWIIYAGSPGVAPFPYFLEGHGKPDMLRVTSGETCAVYLRGTKTEFESRAPSTLRHDLALPTPQRWLGGSSKLVLTSGMQDRYPPHLQKD